MHMPSDPLVVIGTLQALDMTELTVDGLRVNITNATFEDPVGLGDLIEIDIRLDNGTWMAHRVRLSDDDDDDDDRRRDDDDPDFELRGVLEAILGDIIIVSGREIDASRATFDDDVRIGEVVEVKFYRIGGRLVALHVDDDDDDDDDRRTDDRSPAISSSQAAAIALQVYPNATVTDIELSMLGGRMVWDVRLSNGVRIFVDATTGIRLRIEVPGRRDDRRSDDDDDDDDDDDWRSDWDDDDDDDWDDDDDDWDDDDDDDDDD